MTAPFTSQLQDALGPDYRVEQELAGGGMSRLYLATDLRHDRRVVVKVLSPELVSAESTARFKREIELTVRLQHPHILPILTSGSWEDVLYYITPFIPGESLKARIERDHKLPLDDIVKILRDVSGALAFAHQRGIVHRDVKPGNILLAEGHAILADFGIARAMVTNATPLTGSGMVPGTPAYMAPELPTDERADVYSLGVVAYEMLCASLPKRGMTAKDIAASRGRVPGDSPSRVQAMAALVADAFSASPERRTATVADFAARLEELTVARPRRWMLAGAGVAAAAVLAAAAFAAARMVRPTLNADRFVVLSLGTTTPTKSALVARITDAFSEWRGLNLADPNAVSAAVQRSASDTLQLRGGSVIARKLNARNVVGIEAATDGDSTVIRASLYDAAGDTTIKSRRAAFARTDDASAQRMIMRRLVNSLVRDGDELPWTSASDRDTPSIDAWRAYDRGRAAIARWDLAAAESSFRSSVGIEPRLSLAHLWLAQTQMWQAGSAIPDDARATIRRALDGRPALAGHDSIDAVALQAMSEKQFDRACQAYRSLIARDSSDFTAWLGVGDCQARDRAIVRGPGNASVFRGSWEGAARAYQRANEIGPSGPDAQFRGWLLGRLSTVLYTVSNRVRSGRVSGSDSVVLAAFPYLDHDSLAFAPITMADLSKGVGSPEPAKIERAVARNRVLLRSAAEEWVRRSPKSAAAYDSLAAWTEVSGGVATVAEQQISTLDIVNYALRYATDSTQRLRLGISRVRLLVKDGKFANARREADSLLAAGAGARAGAVSGVAGLAALTGRVGQTVSLASHDPNTRAMQTSDGSIVAFPKQVAEVVTRLIVHTAFGTQEDSVRASARALVDLIPTYFPDTNVATRLRGTLLPTALSFAYPMSAQLFAAERDGPDQTANAMRHLAAGDSTGARTMLADLRRMGAGRVAGLSVDATFRRARLAVALGDTATALRELDPVLKALPMLGPDLLDRVVQTTSLVRALALRAELARRTDPETARTCARAVIDLWSNADAALQPIVDRMTAIAH